MNISVVICTHNPREDYLKRVLEALKAQTLPKDQWELLLVDNASANPLAKTWDLSWHPNARHLHEKSLGLTHARLRGIAESQGELLVFVDDDNVLRSDYLHTALKISAEYPKIGAWAGSCFPEYEVEPPEELRPWLAGLVVEKLTASIWGKLRVWSEAGPSGAGMVLRRSQGKYYYKLAANDPLRLSLDRCGKALGSGGDGDMALCGFSLGLGTGRFPELELTHLISSRRLTLEYLEGLYEGFGFGGAILQALHCPELVSKPSRMQAFQNLLWRGGLLMSEKSRVNRRIRWSQRRGRWQALCHLDGLGFFDQVLTKVQSH